MEAIARRFPGRADDVDRTDHWLVLPGRELLVRIYRPARALAGDALSAWRRVGGRKRGHARWRMCRTGARCRDRGGERAVRRTPENPWPAPNDDCYAALVWLAGQAGALDIDPGRIGVGGDSAGAHLALGVALEARAQGGPALALQLLVYPVVEPDFDTPSYRRHAETATLTRADMMEYWQLYLPPGSPDPDARALPGRAPLHGLPPACIVVAGMDPLYDEGKRLAAQLGAAGVRTTLLDAPTLTHGFLRAAPYVPAARQMQRQITEVLSRSMHR